MASRRVAQSAVKWTEFEKLVPGNQLPAFIALKAKSANFVQKVHSSGPEEKPKIDFELYKRLLTGAPGLVDSFEKAYGALAVPYPIDTGNLKAAVDAQEVEAGVKTVEYITGVQEAVTKAKVFLEKIDRLPAFNQFTIEMMYDYFPDQCLHNTPWKPTQGVGPTIWPHTKFAQPLPGDARGAKWEHPYPG